MTFHTKHDFQDSFTLWCTQTGHIWRVPSVHRGRICFNKYRILHIVLSTGSPWAWWQDPDCPEQGWHGGPPGWKFTPGFIQLFLFYISSGIDAGIWSSDVELGQGITITVYCWNILERGKKAWSAQDCLSLFWTSSLRTLAHSSGDLPRHLGPFCPFWVF